MSKIETFINKHRAFSSERQIICTCVCFDKRYNACQEMMQEFSRQLEKNTKDLYYCIVLEFSN